jgi:serine protease AprX
MFPSALQWLRSGAGSKLHPRLRRRVLQLYRPPGWLPCWFHSLWYWAVPRLVRVSLIIRHEGDCSNLKRTLSRHGCRVSRDLEQVGFVCARAPLYALHDICCCYEVRRIWPETEIKAYLDTALQAAGAVRAAGRYTGQGVTIAVVDTGIHPHPDLEGRIIAFADMVGRRTRPYDDNGHGTHVAGCAAGSGSRSKGRFRGMAPGASLVGVKVLNKAGTGRMSDLLAGIEWVVRNKSRYGIRIMSVSLGAEAALPCSDDPLCQAVEAACEAGIVVVAAAGNDGPEAGTIGTPGISPRAITVGAMDDRGTPERRDDQIASFSSRGPAPGGVPKPDLLSPGVAITSLRSPGSFLDKHHRQARVDDDYTTLSGTSMATPLVSGLIALLLEAEPDLTPDQVRQRLLATATDWGLSPNEQGAGYVHADRLLEQEGDS